MLSESRPSLDLPFVPTLLCLWGAGFVTSLVTSFVFAGNPYALTRSSPFMVGASLLVDAAVGAAVVQYLLQTVVGRDLPYASILVALIAGSVTSLVVRIALFPQMQTGQTTSAGRWFLYLGLINVPALAGAFVEFWLLQKAALGSEPPNRATAIVPPSVTTDDLLDEEPRTRGSYSAVVVAVRESSLGLVAAVDAAEPSSVPTVIGNGLFPLEAAKKRLEETPPPEDVPPDLTHRLASALGQLGFELTETANAAAIAANQSTYDRGLLGARLATSSDHGGRYRWALDESAGLRTVREALHELERLGYGANRD